MGRLARRCSAAHLPGAGRDPRSQSSRSGVVQPQLLDGCRISGDRRRGRRLRARLGRSAAVRDPPRWQRIGSRALRFSCTPNPRLLAGPAVGRCGCAGDRRRRGRKRPGGWRQARRWPARSHRGGPSMVGVADTDRDHAPTAISRRPSLSPPSSQFGGHRTLARAGRPPTREVLAGSGPGAEFVGPGDPGHSAGDRRAGTRAGPSQQRLQGNPARPRSQSLPPCDACGRKKQAPAPDRCQRGFPGASVDAAFLRPPGRSRAPAVRAVMSGPDGR
jgi:hypothetical protein